MNPRWAVNQLQNGMGLRPGERVLAIVDEPLRAAGEALCATARALGAGRAELRVVPGAAPALALVPSAFLRQVSEADVVISLMSRLDLQRESPMLRAGLAAFRAAGRGRWAAGACIDQAVVEEDLAFDCQAIAEATAAMAARLALASRVRLVTEAGTDLTFSIAGRPVHQDPGVLRSPGSYGNLPAGEAFVAPLEMSAEGKAIIDLSIGDIPLDEPVSLTFRAGRVVAVAGGAAARELEQRLGHPETNPGAWTLGEFGLGTNAGLRLRGRAPLDEKAAGTAHIALGGNAQFGGANPADTHYDCVINRPAVYLDGAEI